MRAQVEEFHGQCPYCGETILMLIDTSAGSRHYIEDCAVCCRPIQVLVSIDLSGDWQVQLKHENDT
ncbi:CPXCG motif-containing cysteine-rich protein [Microbulbifer sp. HZ11]|uniref:CPXCG motif-containing cysteine-rich protein n=1 Tax=unclassified Microbulbifer TaxID=2619833 RepID=UPI0005BA2897|nr:CPXCG motif-containing cysteine-rich protein [Microbulbifer sp. HZ11]